MKYRYRNVKTGEVITTTNRVGGRKWERVEDNPVLPPKEDFEEGVLQENPEPVEEAVEPPVEKPAAKASRKGKK